MDKTKIKLEQYLYAIEKSNIVSKTDPKGLITFVNDEFCQISGYSKEELIGSNHNIIRHPDVGKETFRRLWGTILHKQVYKGIVKNRAKDGRAFYLNATIIPILDENGEIEEFVAIRHDVTEIINLNRNLLQTKSQLKQLNEELEDRVKEQTKELKELNSSLEDRVKAEIAKNEEKNRIMFQQSRLATMGEMIANIAHQWRQPLNELSLVIYNLKISREKKDEFDSFYEKSKKIIASMSQTIEDFSNFFKTDKNKDEFLVSASIHDVVSLIGATLTKLDINLDIKQEFDCYVYGLKSELMQVLMNLITNAKDALLKEYGIIKKVITITVYKKDEFVCIDVNENASAIRPEVLDRIYEPYFTTKHPNSGTGLGLYMSKMIIDNMRGYMEVKNLDKDVSFIIKLPIIKKEK
ncbi:MAG: PAS domain S-box protein [Campylobacter sp.]|nr:PAS domain S-box protein [Campylobacter sp.]